MNFINYHFLPSYFKIISEYLHLPLLPILTVETLLFPLFLIFSFFELPMAFDCNDGISLLVITRLNNIDLFAAGIAETPLDGAVIGPTFACIIGRQLQNVTFGDRFFYAIPKDETGERYHFTQGRFKMIGLC